jgi:hypothetical protein
MKKDGIQVQVKLDTGALINLAHSSHLSKIKRCEEYNFPPIRLNGVGGSTQPYQMVGVLSGVTDCGQTRTALCYVVDNPIAGDKAICLIGLRTIVDWGIDLRHHMLEALRGECNPMHLLEGGMSSKAFLVNKAHSSE